MGDVVLGEGLVEHNLVQPVEELGPEGVVQQIVDGIFRLGGDVALLIDAVQQVLGPQVGGEDDNGVLEIHGSALTVGNPAVVNTWSNMLNTSGWAFSISSNRMTQ